MVVAGSEEDEEVSTTDMTTVSGRWNVGIREPRPINRKIMNFN